MIEVRGLGKRFGPPPRHGLAGREALRDVDLTVPEGQCWAVVGPNGAGKSTLLGILLGFLHPTRGEATVAGLAPAEYARRHGAAVLPERVRLPEAWTPASTLRAIAALEGAPAGAAPEALVDWGLEAEAHLPWRALSTGTRQRLLLAQSLLASRSLVVLDEPTAGLDPTWRLRLRERLLTLRDAGRTILMASHDLAEVERVADRVVVLEDGRVRDTLAARASASAAWLIEVLEDGGQRTGEAVRAAFSGAGPVAAAGPGDGARGGPGVASYRVSAAGAADLSARLAALLASGVVVRAVHPAGEALEERVRQALAGDA